MVLAALCALPGTALADDRHADALFREGRTLLDAKRFDEACPKLAESQKLEPGAGTLLALALCHEGQGKTATASQELKQAAELGRRVGRNDLASAAQKRGLALEASLSKLVVRMPEGDTSAYAVRCDGESLDSADLGKPFAVDTGEHKVEVSAKGKTPRSYTVRLSGAGLVEIVVDRLEDAKAPAAVVAPAAAKPRAVVLAPVVPPPAADQGNVGGTQRVIGLATAGIGVVGLGVGAYFGGRALSEQAEGKRTCPTTPCPNGAPNEANDRAKDSFKMSVIGLSAGTGAIAIGAVVYLLAPSSSPASAAAPMKRFARVVPEAGPGQVGLGVIGAF